MKPKSNRKPGPLDNCQTPPYALEPLIPYLDPSKSIWECASGNGSIVKALDGFEVISTDILTGTDFLSCWNEIPYSCTIVTNPPYSIKQQWIKRCYELEFPFALLLPVETIGTSTAQKMFDKYGIEIILMSPRVDFYMPNKGYEGAGAQFPTAWFTWKLHLPQQINFARLNKPKRSELEEYWKEALGE